MKQRGETVVSSIFTQPATLRPQAALWYLLAVGLVLLAWALRLHRLDGQSFWYDEAYAVHISELAPAEALLWSSRDLVPPFHPYLLSLWLPLSGSKEFSARFLSTWMGTLSVAAFVGLGRNLHSRRAGLLTGMLAAFSPFYVWHSQDARMYMSQAALGLLATLLLVRALRRPERWWQWAGLALLDALTLYTQATGGFLIAFHAVVILISGLGRAGRPRLTRGGLALVSALLVWLPWLMYALPLLEENAGYWSGRLSWQFIGAGAFRGFVSGEMMDGMAESVALGVWGAAALAGLVILFLSSDAGRRTALFLLGYFAVPVAVMAWLFASVPKFSPRYLIVASPPLFLLPGLGVAALLSRCAERPAARRVLGGLTIVALVTTASLGLSNLYYNSSYAKSDFRTAARVVQEQMTADEIVLLVPGHTFPVWQFYFGSEGWVALPDDPILDVRNTLHYRNTAERLNEWLADRSGVWLVEWDPRVVDPTDLVVSLLGQVGEELPLAKEPAGIQLRHYRLRADRFPLPPDPVVPPPVDAALNLPLTLLGCHLPEAVRGDEEVRVACYWEATDTLPHHLSISARLLDAADVGWGQADSPISGPHLVAGRWPLGEPVLGHYVLRPFPGIPPGDFYRLQLLAYEPGGTVYGMVTAGPLVVDRPSRPFTATLASSQVSPARLGGLVLEAVDIAPDQVLPGEEVRVEAIWRVAGPFEEPHLTVEGSADEILLLPEHGATGLWKAGDRYLTVSRVRISPHAFGGTTTLQAVSRDGRVPLGTVHVDISRTFTLPAGVQPVGYRLGDVISLVAVQLSVRKGDAGETAEVVLYWRAERTVEQSYSVFVHLTGPDGQIYAQADGLPQAGRHPTTHWLPGEVVTDSYLLQRPAEAPSGQYRVLTGLYDLATMERLPVTDAGGNLVPDDAILVGRWESP